MATKYLYIDDDKNAHGIVKAVEEQGVLEFDIRQPKTWNEQKEEFIDKGEINRYDGLLLDLKLEFSSGGSNDVKFSGADLAQTIRTAAKSNSAISDLPIILCSTDDLLMSYLDRTSYDLFDVKYAKDHSSKYKALNQNEFICFAQAYRTVNDTKDLFEIVKKKSDSVSDLQILKLEIDEFETPHEIMYLLNRYFINATGPLVDEALLAIRLGVDISKSSDWEILKDHFLRPYKYEGVLSGCYDRWWMDEINTAFKSRFGKSLKILNADERITLLKSIENVDDIVAMDIPQNHSFGTFWYKCKLSGLPLDPSDGLRTIEMPRYSWQEPSYISISYLMSDERERVSILKSLGPIERQIFESFD